MLMVADGFEMKVVLLRGWAFGEEVACLPKVDTTDMHA
jgi:hypothetical protein